MKSKKNILVCPLDWGLGHATRMIPVINEIENQGGRAIVAADNGPMELLSQYYPNKTIIKLEGFQPHYPANGSMAWAMMKSFPEMIATAKFAKNKLQQIIDEHQINAVISDNRYELSNPNIPSIFVTHQLNIQTTGFQVLAKPTISRVINHFISNYNEIWVPDLNNHYLSGILSTLKSERKNLHYVGLLSRFTEKCKLEKQKDIDVLVILSGPEPQRTILEKLIIEQASQTNLKTVILQGKPQDKKHQEKDNITIIPHGSDDEIINLIVRSKHLICRPGYSTLMDLAVLNTNAIFIPTPGQTEQEYLAKKLMKEGIAFSESQQLFNFSEAIKKQHQYSGLKQPKKEGALKKRITYLLNNC